MMMMAYISLQQLIYERVIGCKIIGCFERGN